MSNKPQNNDVKQIAADDLRKMETQEGLILQGCGGDLQELGIPVVSKQKAIGRVQANERPARKRGDAR